MKVAVWWTRPGNAGTLVAIEGHTGLVRFDYQAGPDPKPVAMAGLHKGNAPAEHRSPARSPEL